MLSLIVLAAVVAHTPDPSTRARPLEMPTASVAQTAVIRQLLGDEFVKGDGAFPSRLLASEPDLNGDGASDLVTSQRGLCSNHTCNYELFLRTGSGWRHLASLEDWGDLYLIPPRTGTMKRIVIFEHLTDDCLACSAPEPVWVDWHPNRFTASGEQGDYIVGNSLTVNERRILVRPIEPK